MERFIGIAVFDNARHKGTGKELIQSVIKSEEIERMKRKKAAAPE